eukprot:jgi/Mesvir1/27419/Mv07215-RA.1
MRRSEASESGSESDDDGPPQLSEESLRDELEQNKRKCGEHSLLRKRLHVACALRYSDKLPPSWIGDAVDHHKSQPAAKPVQVTLGREKPRPVPAVRLKDAPVLPPFCAWTLMPSNRSRFLGGVNRTPSAMSRQQTVAAQWKDVLGGNLAFTFCRRCYKFACRTHPMLPPPPALLARARAEAAEEEEWMEEGEGVAKEGAEEEEAKAENEGAVADGGKDGVGRLGRKRRGASKGDGAGDKNNEIDRARVGGKRKRRDQGTERGDEGGKGEEGRKGGGEEKDGEKPHGKRPVREDGKEARDNDEGSEGVVVIEGGLERDVDRKGATGRMAKGGGRGERLSRKRPAGNEETSHGKGVASSSSVDGNAGIRDSSPMDLDERGVDALGDEEEGGSARDSATQRAAAGGPPKPHHHHHHHRHGGPEPSTQGRGVSMKRAPGPGNDLSLDKGGSAAVGADGSLGGVPGKKGAGTGEDWTGSPLGESDEKGKGKEKERDREPRHKASSSFVRILSRMMQAGRSVGSSMVAGASAEAAGASEEEDRSVNGAYARARATATTDASMEDEEDEEEGEKGSESTGVLMLADRESDKGMRGRRGRGQGRKVLSASDSVETGEGGGRQSAESSREWDTQDGGKGGGEDGGERGVESPEPVPGDIGRPESKGCAVKKEESECGQGSKRGLSKKSSFQGTRQVSKESADGGMSSADAMDVDVSWQGSPVDELAPVNVLASATHTSPPPGSGGRVAAPGGGAACAPAAAISTGAGGDGPWGTPALVADVPLSGAISSTSGGSSVAGKAGSRGLVVTNGSGSPAGGGGVAGGISAAVKKEQLPVPAEGSQGNMVLVDEDAIGDDASGAEAGGQATRGSLGSQGSLSGHQVSQRSAPGKGPHGGVASRSPPKDGPSGAVGHPGSPRRDTDAVVPRSDVPSQSSAVPSSSIAPQEALPSGRAGDAASSRDQPMDRLGPGPDARSTDRDGRPAGAGHSSSPERGASGSAAIDSLGVKGGPSGTDGRVSVSAVDMKAMREGPGSSFPGRLSQEGKATSPTLRDAAAPGASLGHAEGGLERQAPGAYVTEACNDNGHVEAGCSTLSPASGDVQMVRADDGGGGSGAGGGGGSIGGSGSGGAGGSVDGALGGSGAGGGEGDDSIPVKWTLEEVRIYRKARLLFPNDARGVLTARLLGTKSPQAVRAFREADERRRGEEGSAGGGKQANGIALDGADGGGKGRAGASGGGNDKRGRLGGKGRADGTGNDKLGGGLLGMLSNETGSPEDSKAANEDETAVAATRQRRRRRKGMVTKNRRKQGPYRLATNMLRRVMQNHMDCNKGATARQRSRFMSRGLPSKEGGPTADGGAGNADEGGEAATNPLMLYPKQTYTPCSHAGNKVVTTCNSDAPCSCVRNGTFCEKWCDCPETCNIRFSGCGCRPGQCRGSSCVCRAMHRECDPDLCTGCTGENPDLSDSACQNQAVMRKEHRRLLLGVSDVAGWGVFLRDGAEPDDFICEYVGELVTQKEAQKRGLIYDRQNVSFLFELNSNVCVDATRCGNKSKFANHSNEPNCYMQIMFVNGDQRIAMRARHHIAPGEEVLFNYHHSEDCLPAWLEEERGNAAS